MQSLDAVGQRAQLGELIATSVAAVVGEAQARLAAVDSTGANIVPQNSTKPSG